MTKNEREKIKKAIGQLVDDDYVAGLTILCNLVGIEYGFMRINRCSTFKKIPIDNYKQESKESQTS